MRRPDQQTTNRSAASVLAPYLHEQAAAFLRGLRLHRERGAHGAEEPAAALRHAAHRISGTLRTFRTALDPGWADHLRAELGWLSGTLAREHAYADRMGRLLAALHQLSGVPLPSARSSAPAPSDGGEERAALGTGAARAGALLERRLTLARTRAHSEALQALGSARFHAVADAVALLASDVPLAASAAGPAAEVLDAPAGLAEQRLLAAVAELAPDGAAEPYNEARDAPWHRTRLLLRLHRYAREVVQGAPDPALTGAGRALDLHRDAADAAADASAAARTPRIAPATAYALGVLHAAQRHEVEAARGAFRETWPYAPAVPAP